MPRFKIEVVGPYGHAERLLEELQATANENGFEVAAGPLAADGSLGSVEVIFALVNSATAIAALVVQIVSNRQNYAKSTPPGGGDLHIYLHRDTASIEVVDDDPDTIASAVEMLEDGDGRASS